MSPAGVARALALVAVGAVVGAADIGAADVATTPIDGPSTITRLATATCNGPASGASTAASLLRAAKWRDIELPVPCATAVTGSSAI